MKKIVLTRWDSRSKAEKSRFETMSQSMGVDRFFYSNRSLQKRLTALFLSFSFFQQHKIHHEGDGREKKCSDLVGAPPYLAIRDPRSRMYASQSLRGTTTTARYARSANSPPRLTSIAAAAAATTTTTRSVSLLVDETWSTEQQVLPALPLPRPQSSQRRGTSWWKLPRGDTTTSLER